MQQSHETRGEDLAEALHYLCFQNPNSRRRGGRNVSIPISCGCLMFPPCCFFIAWFSSSSRLLTLPISTPPRTGFQIWQLSTCALQPLYPAFCWGLFLICIFCRSKCPTCTSSWIIGLSSWPFFNHVRQLAVLLCVKQRTEAIREWGHESHSTVQKKNFFEIGGWFGRDLSFQVFLPRDEIHLTSDNFKPPHHAGHRGSGKYVRPKGSPAFPLQAEGAQIHVKWGSYRYR